MITIKVLTKSKVAYRNQLCSTIVMNSLILVTMLFGAVFATGIDKDATIDSQIMEVGLNGEFKNSWSGNGISIQEIGSSKIADNKELAQVIQGVVEYDAPDGRRIKTYYISDDKGYRAEGAHLPVAPPPEPIPEYIARALDWAVHHPYDEAAELKKIYN